MPRDSNGNATRKSPPGAGGYVSGDVISPSQVNGEINDIYTELTNSIDKAGRTKPTANLPMNGKRHTGCGNAVNTTDYATLGQVNTAVAALLPSTTKVVFYQKIPPVGWTAVSVVNDSMLRVVTSNTTGGTYGGTHSPILMDKVPSHTHTISGNTGNQSNDHTHSVSAQYNGTDGTQNGLMFPSGDSSGSGTPSTNGVSADHTHAINFASQANGSASNWTPKYMDVCIGQKS